MLEKKVIHYTKDGVVEENMASGQKRMLTLSEEGKQGHYEKPVLHYGQEQEAARGHPAPSAYRHIDVSVSPLPLHESRTPSSDVVPGPAALPRVACPIPTTSWSHASDRLRAASLEPKYQPSDLFGAARPVLQKATEYRSHVHSRHLALRAAHLPATATTGERVCLRARDAAELRAVLASHDSAARGTGGNSGKEIPRHRLLHAAGLLSKGALRVGRDLTSAVTSAGAGDDTAVAKAAGKYAGLAAKKTALVAGKALSNKMRKVAPKAVSKAIGGTTKFAAAIIRQGDNVLGAAGNADAGENTVIAETLARYTGTVVGRATVRLGRKAGKQALSVAARAARRAAAAKQAAQRTAKTVEKAAKRAAKKTAQKAGETITHPVGTVIKIVIFLVVALVVFINISTQSNQNGLLGGYTLIQTHHAGSANLPPAVLAYQNTVDTYAVQYDMSDYVDLILAVMAQESGGEGTDPMQAAEGAYNTRYPHVPGGITDPMYSIQCGIQELHAALAGVRCKGSFDMPNIEFALQTYNFGYGYIAYAKAHGGHSHQVALDFAKQQSGGKQRDPASSMFASAGPWAYGDQNYPAHVLRYYDGVGGGEGYDDATFQQIKTEGEKYLGMAYVFGGSTPQTGFDCSGFVCWVYTHSGAHNLPRTTAQGIYDQCTHIEDKDAKPGDLVFYTGTYDSGTPVSHVGIYCGNNVMLHCGDPIQYTKISTSYWQSHFYAFGRLA